MSLEKGPWGLFLVFKEKSRRQFKAMWDCLYCDFHKTCLTKIYGTLATYARVRVAYAPLGFL